MTNDELMKEKYIPDSREAYRVINGLWQLLDDIDTLSDMAKYDYKLFAEKCYDIQQKRWQIYNISDPGSICKTQALLHCHRCSKPHNDNDGRYYTYCTPCSDKADKELNKAKSAMSNQGGE